MAHRLQLAAPLLLALATLALLAGLRPATAAAVGDYLIVFQNSDGDPADNFVLTNPNEGGYFITTNVYELENTGWARLDSAAITGDAISLSAACRDVAGEPSSCPLDLFSFYQNPETGDNNCFCNRPTYNPTTNTVDFTYPSPDPFAGFVYDQRPLIGANMVSFIGSVQVTGLSFVYSRCSCLPEVRNTTNRPASKPLAAKQAHTRRNNKAGSRQGGGDLPGPTVAFYNLVPEPNVDLGVTLAGPTNAATGKPVDLTATVVNKPNNQAIVGAHVTFVSTDADGNEVVLGEATTDNLGVATLPVSFELAGVYTIAARTYGWQGEFDVYSNPLDIVVKVPVPEFNCIELHPAKAKRACDDPIRVTALVLNGTEPVPGVNVTFSISGDCMPFLDGTARRTALAGPDGKASIEFSVSQPGRVAVVAAGTSATGLVLSKAAQVAFFSHHSYYRNGGEDGHDYSWDARYANEATQQAITELSAPVVSAKTQAKP